jgi:dimethylhistidine N-methyltransferase
VAIRATQTTFLDEFAMDARTGLGGTGQKTLPSRYLYDDLGSALFEAIGYLPEYGLTRADERILRERAGEIVAPFQGGCVVAELGSGSGKKTRWLLEALASRRPVSYYPIDISSAALARCELELSRIEGVRVDPMEADYLSGLSLVAARRRNDERLLLLFLGSTIGNFEPAEALDFLREIRVRLRPGDGFLLGTDLVKPEAVLQLAYDDPLQVTAAFNRNLLVRVNLELGADFDPAAFRHAAFYNRERWRIEMHLVSTIAQRVRIGEAAFDFRAGESIHTENSYKYDVAAFATRAAGCGLRLDATGTDAQNYFAVLYLTAR